MIRDFLKDEEGMGTVELVLIIAALVTIAIIFRKTITDFINDKLGDIFGKAATEGDIKDDELKSAYPQGN